MKGIGPKFISINGRVLYDLDVIEQWEREHTHQSTAEYDTGARGESMSAVATQWNAQRRQQRAGQPA